MAGVQVVHRRAKARAQIAVVLLVQVLISVTTLLNQRRGCHDAKILCSCLHCTTIGRAAQNNSARWAKLWYTVLNCWQAQVRSEDDCETGDHICHSIRGGFDYQASCRRLCGAYRREPVDHVPIVSPIPWQPYDDIDGTTFGDWRDEERFRRIARLVQKHCDPKPPYNRVGIPRIFAPQSYQRFLEAPQEFIEELPPEQVSEIRTRHTTLLHTPKGDLKWVYEQDAGVFTWWDIHKPVQCVEDVEKLLSVPYAFHPPDPAEFEPFRRHRADMGANAIGGAGVNSMVAMLCGIMSYQLMLEWLMLEPALIELLADTWLERTGAKVDWLLAQGVGPFWHFNGVERAAPPMMSPAAVGPVGGAL